MNPVHVEMLRDDWDDHPDLTDGQRAKLRAVSGDRLREALDAAFVGYQDMWWHILDEVRSIATAALLEDFAAGRDFRVAIPPKDES